MRIMLENSSGRGDNSIGARFTIIQTNERMTELLTGNFVPVSGTGSNGLRPTAQRISDFLSRTLGVEEVLWSTHSFAVRHGPCFDRQAVIGLVVVQLTELVGKANVELAPWSPEEPEFVPFSVGTLKDILSSNHFTRQL